MGRRNVCLSLRRTNVSLSLGVISHSLSSVYLLNFNDMLACLLDWEILGRCQKEFITIFTLHVTVASSFLYYCPANNCRPRVENGSSYHHHHTAFFPLSTTYIHIYIYKTISPSLSPSPKPSPCLLRIRAWVSPPPPLAGKQKQKIKRGK